MRDLDKVTSGANEIFDRLNVTLVEMRGIVSSITSLVQNIDDLKAGPFPTVEKLRETERRPVTSEQRAAALVGWIDELMAWMMDAIDVSEHGHRLDAGQRSDGEKILAGTRAALAAAAQSAATEGAGE